MSQTGFIRPRSLLPEFLLLAALATLWGTSQPFIKIGV
jgi:hypothetical protein